MLPPPAPLVHHCLENSFFTSFTFHHWALNSSGQELRLFHLGVLHTSMVPDLSQLLLLSLFCNHRRDPIHSEKNLEGPDSGPSTSRPLLLLCLTHSLTRSLFSGHTGPFLLEQARHAPATAPLHCPDPDIYKAGPLRSFRSLLIFSVKPFLNTPLKAASLSALPRTPSPLSPPYFSPQYVSPSNLLYIFLIHHLSPPTECPLREGSQGRHPHDPRLIISAFGLIPDLVGSFYCRPDLCGWNERIMNYIKPVALAYFF